VTQAESETRSERSAGKDKEGNEAIGLGALHSRSGAAVPNVRPCAVTQATGHNDSESDIEHLGEAETRCLEHIAP
jgi:hypothetical protein